MPDPSFIEQDLLGSRELRFNNRQESVYPNLMRFCMDFKFKVLQLLLSPTSEGDVPGKVVVMTRADFAGDPDSAITPAFTELEQLERYVRDNQVDILHSYLFGVDDISGAAG